MSGRRGEFHVTVGEMTECLSECRSCHAAVIFKPSPKRRPGKSPATLILSVKSAEPCLTGGLYLLSHFYDCPDAKKWKKR